MVKKPQDEYSKPRKFRDRRDKEKISTKREAPKNPPYERPHTNWNKVVVDGLGEDDFIDMDDPCREGHCVHDEEGSDSVEQS